MKIEHIAWNVSDPEAIAQWYAEQFGLTVIRHLPHPNQTYFLVDDDTTILEIYHNPSAPVPDYASMDPLVLHLAFSSEDPSSDTARLITAGATLHTDLNLPDGSHLVMLRDPWGFSIQLCKRATSLIKSSNEA